MTGMAKSAVLRRPCAKTTGVAHVYDDWASLWTHKYGNWRRVDFCAVISSADGIISVHDITLLYSFGGFRL